MSAYFSKFNLNTYSATPYFQAHLPPDYPLSLVLQKSRAFRRLPYNLRKLSTLAKRWLQHVDPDPLNRSIDDWYDADGYELNPKTGKRLTDPEIDAEWDPDPVLERLEIRDIPIPPNGFANPEEWEEPALSSEDTSHEDRGGLTLEQLIHDIHSYGKEYVANYYGIPANQAERAGSDESLAQIILSKIDGRLLQAEVGGG